MYQIILLIHVFIAFCIVALVLVQQGKGATMGAAFGAGASSTVFGSRGSGSFLFRITVAFICLFFLTSIGLNYLASQAYKQQKVISVPAMPVIPSKPASDVAVPPAPAPVDTSVTAPANTSVTAPADTSATTPVNTNAPAPAETSAPASEVPVRN